MISVTPAQPLVARGCVAEWRTPGLPYMAARLYDNGTQRAVTLACGPADRPLEQLDPDGLCEVAELVAAAWHWAAHVPQQLELEVG